VLASAWIAIAAVWAAVVFDVVSETAGKERGIVAFGRELADPGRTVTIWIVAGLVATAVLGLAVAVGSAVVRQRERRAAAELDARFERLAAAEAADVARRDQLAKKVEALHRRIESLSRERQAIEDALGRERRKARELRALAVRTARELDTATQALQREMATPARERDGVVVIHDAEGSERSA
jgi:septal ring factor EnvC (AmiA/AmiB activator)